MPHLLCLACAMISWADPPANPPPVPASALDVVSALETVLADAIAKAEPSVVAIARVRSSEGDETTAVRGRTPPLRPVEPGLAAGNFELFENESISFDYGSGVVIGERGEILTAYHVVKGASRLKVRALGHHPFDAEVIAADPRSDLAVIVPRRSPEAAPPKLVPIAIGDASKLRKGAFLIALGNPYNAMRVGGPGGSTRDGRPSASWGILSNVARRLEPPLGERVQGRSLTYYPTLLQLDAKLNLGMSGGAVINLKGELVGLTTAGANAAGFDAQAGYAIPMDEMGRRQVETLRQGKEVEYGFLGISLDDRAGTNLVKDAQPGTPAGEGGVLSKDLVLAVGDIPVADAEELLLAINAFEPGTVVKLKLMRGNEVIERSVELAKLPIGPAAIATNRPPAWRGVRVDYPSNLPDVQQGEDILGALARGGVLVVDVEGGSRGEKAGLRPGQVITHVRGQKVRNPRDFAKAVGDGGQPVTLTTVLGPVVVK